MDSQKRLVIVTLLSAAFVMLVASTQLPGHRVINTTTKVYPYEDVRSLSIDSDVFYEASQSLLKSGTSTQTEIPSAHAYLVGNIKTGTIYIEHNSVVPLPVASMSKLITSIAAMDTIDSSIILKIADDISVIPTDGSNLKPGEQFTLDEILQPLLLDSSNVAAETIASSSNNRAQFMELMSSYAWEVGMPSSFFADPSGLSPRNIASARDMFALAQYLYKSRPEILAITRIAHTSLATTTEHGFHDIVSTHPFAGDSRFIGGKTGRTTAAGETMLTMLNINDQPIAFVVMGSDLGAREYDTRLLMKKLEKMSR